MLQAGSLGCRLRWSLVPGCVSGLPLGSTLWNQEGGNRVGQTEGSSWITGQTTWADPLGGLEWRWPFRVVLTHPLARPLCLPMDGSLHRSCPQRADGLRLPTCSTYSSWTMSSWREIRTTHLHVPTACVTDQEVGDEDILWGKTLDDWCVSQNFDLVILLNTLWSKKYRRRSM